MTVVSTGERIDEREALRLYGHETLHDLGAAAHKACRARHPEPYRTFAIDRNINYTNVCVAGCRFCAFSTAVGSPDGWVLDRKKLLDKIAELADAGGTHVLLQGGVHPDLSLGWHEQMLRDIRGAFPGIHVHGYSPPEIWAFATQGGLELRAVLDRLRSAGLGSIPGGGAEILVDRVRQIVSPRKCTADQWIEVMRQAHGLGMFTTATMMFGHVETEADRIEHLRRLRELQDESLDRGKGCFTAFICWTFQSANTALQHQWAEREDGWASGPDHPSRPPARPPWHEAGAYVYLRTLAVARLYLDSFDNLQASWVTQGPKIGQLALFYGANDMGGVMMEENVVSAAGTTYRMSPGEVRHLIEDAGWQARQRNVHYELVD